MADPKQVDLLRQGVEEWNQYAHTVDKIDLSGADLSLTCTGHMGGGSVAGEPGADRGRRRSGANLAGSEPAGGEP